MPKTQLHPQIDRIVDRALSIVETLLDGLDPPRPRYDARDPACTAPWRWTNDEFGFWRLCTRRTCRRARCCRGEPRACFERHLPATPQETRETVRAKLRAKAGLWAQTKVAKPAPNKLRKQQIPPKFHKLWKCSNTSNG